MGLGDTELRELALRTKDFNLACTLNDTSIIKKLYNPKIHTWRWGVTRGYNNVIAIFYLEGIRFDTFDFNPIDTASEYGHIDMVIWLCKYTVYSPTSVAIDSASKNGHLEIVKILVKYNVEPTACAIDFGAGNGHIEVLKYLFDIGGDKVKYTAWALDFAAGNGHVKVVEWLLDHCQTILTDYALSWAIQNGHHDIVFLLQNNQKVIDALNYKKTFNYIIQQINSTRFINP